MKQIHDHPDESTLGLRKETYEELQARVVVLSRAVEAHLGVRTRLMAMLRTPTPGMLMNGQILLDMGGDSKEIWELMATHGLLEMLHRGEL